MTPPPWVRDKDPRIRHIKLLRGYVLAMLGRLLAPIILGVAAWGLMRGLVWLLLGR